MITMIHMNPVRIDGNTIRIDRKFHDGMQRYCSTLDGKIVSIHPLQTAQASGMDIIELDRETLGYEILGIELAPDSKPIPAEKDRLAAQIAASDIVYGYGLGASGIARKAGIPYIPVLEYDLGTQITMSLDGVSNPIKRALRVARCTRSYFTEERAAVRHAQQVHCNGYPIFEAIQSRNTDRILYLDSRMSRDSVIPADRLEARLAERKGRALRLLFSGRYEGVKGALDAVRVGAACLAQGLDIEMHCYGKGSQKQQMLDVAQSPEARGRIFIHDAIPFPELVKRSQDFDVFVCCHIQNDPSCTYLETFGAGVPVVGYANRMWQRLSHASGVGYSSPIGDVDQVAKTIASLSANPQELDEMSKAARQFALDHCWEHEFAVRTDALKAVLRDNRAKA